MGDLCTYFGIAVRNFSHHVQHGLVHVTLRYTLFQRVVVPPTAGTVLLLFPVIGHDHAVTVPPPSPRRVLKVRPSFPGTRVLQAFPFLQFLRSR